MSFSDKQALYITQISKKLRTRLHHENRAHPRAIDSGVSNILINGKPIAMTGAAIDSGREPGQDHERQMNACEQLVRSQKFI